MIRLANKSDTALFEVGDRLMDPGVPPCPTGVVRINQIDDETGVISCVACSRGELLRAKAWWYVSWPWRIARELYWRAKFRRMELDEWQDRQPWQDD